MPRGVMLALGAGVHDPGDPMAGMFFNVPAIFAGFEADLIRLRTRESRAIARTRGRLPKLFARQQKERILQPLPTGGPLDRPVDSNGS
ncbi:MAG: hypothetical protein ACREFK_10640 [Stellaceae bacterium]